MRQIVTRPPAPVLQVTGVPLETNLWDALAPEFWYCIIAGMGNQLSAAKFLTHIYGSI